MQSLTAVCSELHLNIDANAKLRKTQNKRLESERPTARQAVWSREAINSVNEGKHVMTGPQSH